MYQMNKKSKDKDSKKWSANKQSHCQLSSLASSSIRDNAYLDNLSYNRLSLLSFLPPLQWQSNTGRNELLAKYTIAKWKIWDPASYTPGSAALYHI